MGDNLKYWRKSKKINLFYPEKEKLRCHSHGVNLRVQMGSCPKNFLDTTPQLSKNTSVFVFKSKNGFFGIFHWNILGKKQNCCILGFEKIFFAPSHFFMNWCHITILSLVPCQVINTLVSRFSLRLNKFVIVRIPAKFS